MDPLYDNKKEKMMDKEKITSGEELIAMQKAFAERFLVENPIFIALKLTDAQMQILFEDVIIPKFNQKYDVSYRAKQQAYFQLKSDD